LDSLVEKLIGGSSIADVSAEVTKAAADLKSGSENKYAEYYIKVFDKLSKSEAYTEKELKRLSNILQKGGLTTEKVDEFTSKTNILKKFVQKPAGKSEL
jgi:protein disulfide-isomerase A6